MNTNVKLAIVAFGLCMAAIVLVVGLRMPRNGDAILAPVRPPPAFLSAAERVERAKQMDGFRKAMVDAHDRMLKLLIDSLAYSGGDFCGRGRRSLRDSMDTYAHTHFTDIDLAVTQDLMSDEDMAQLWGGPRDANAIGQANFRLQHGFILKEDFGDQLAGYLKIFSFPDNVTPACPGPIIRNP